jgi:pimeloyl-ACP methyl ester carboxylesterase
VLVIAIEVLLGVIVGLAVVVAAAFVAGRWFFVERFPDEVHYARTADGWRIALCRYRPETPNGREPVLVCHGIAANAAGVDLTEELSLPRALARAGWDAWLLELRGRGQSAQPRLFGEHDWDWSFDEYVERDAPAAIAALLRATGRDKLHWVGFSLGALVGYGVCMDPALGGKIARAVAIAGPASYKMQRRYLFHFAVRNLRWLRHAFLSRLFAPIAGLVRTNLLVFDHENVPAEVMRRYHVNASANFARNEMLQYSDWLEHDAFRSIDQRRDYRAGLSRIVTPTLFIAGNKDLLAPPPAVKDAHDAVGSAEKRFVIASRGQAFQAHYGHLDLVLGRTAPKEIVPLIEGWLAARPE